MVAVGLSCVASRAGKSYKMLNSPKNSARAVWDHDYLTSVTPPTQM